MTNFPFILGAPGEARWRQAVQVRGVPEAVQPQDRPPTAHVPAHRREAVHLRRVRERLHPGGPDGEACGHSQEEGGPRRRRDHVTPGGDVLARPQHGLGPGGATPPWDT